MNVIVYLGKIVSIDGNIYQVFHLKSIMMAVIGYWSILVF